MIEAVEMQNILDQGRRNAKIFCIGGLACLRRLLCADRVCCGASADFRVPWFVTAPDSRLYVAKTAVKRGVVYEPDRLWLMESKGLCVLRDRMQRILYLELSQSKVFGIVRR
jgi:hypothetical protein